MSPSIEICDKKGSVLVGGSSLLPVKANVVVKDGEKVKLGQILVKIPRESGQTKDITGGLPKIASF